MYSTETFLAYSVGAYWNGVANNGMTKEERKSLDPSSHEYWLRYGSRVVYSVSQQVADCSPVSMVQRHNWPDGQRIPCYSGNY